jgi:hypothetical protein
MDWGFPSRFDYIQEVLPIRPYIQELERRGGMRKGRAERENHGTMVRVISWEELRVSCWPRV